MHDDTEGNDEVVLGDVADLTEVSKYEPIHELDEVPVPELDLERSSVVPDLAPFVYEGDPGKGYVQVVINASFDSFRKGDRLTVDGSDEEWAGHIASGMASVVD
jgi:hypothetical protein